MNVVFREARREDVPAVVEMLADDMLGQSRERAGMEAYLAAFDAMAREAANRVYVGEIGGEIGGETGGEIGGGSGGAPDFGIVATYQLTFISGLSLGAARRAQVESVRVASRLRGRGIGAQMFADIEARARAAGCSLVQLTMNAGRVDSRRFYEGLGFVASHAGFKKSL